MGSNVQENGNNVSFPKIDMTISITDEEKLKQDLRFIARKSKKEWENLKDDEISLDKFTSGLTNIIWGAKVKEDQILIRIYGNSTELFLDREGELETLKIIYKLGVGPQVFVSFNNGYSYEFYRGKPLVPNDLFTGKYNAKIADWIGQWHRKDFEVKNKTPKIWSVIEKFYSIVPEKYSDERKQKIFEEMNIEKIRAELPALRKELESQNSPVVFCHNDLLGLNIIYDDRTDKINFIDYEYATLNFAAYDIANHFNEWAGFECYFNQYPSKELQFGFFKAYLKAFNGREPTEKELNDLYVEVSKFTLASHYFWGVWALAQAEISSIDFDYMDYARKRFKQYFATRDDLFKLHK
eukprot:TRINITY_DN24876_c0_g1_i1.p1 TRINITY_DN24876_c0_g1~~TRINITY_DN24876_c0_g1_i1.p1  ORF type:complete len:353 (-),score=113.41 TRINITY_DN24876_c0_g1_i1:6-1064(-)